LLEAGRERIREGSILYCDTCPCLTCTVKIAQVGISEVVYSQGYNMDQESAAILKAAGVCLRQFSPVSYRSLPDSTKRAYTNIASKRPHLSPKFSEHCFGFALDHQSFRWECLIKRLFMI
jgi:deoxycytidylate deaminase